MVHVRWYGSARVRESSDNLHSSPSREFNLLVFYWISRARFGDIAISSIVKYMYKKYKYNLLLILSTVLRCR
jgi:hypothetical protein